MNVIKQVSYVKLPTGYQTYLFTANLDSIRYKVFSTQQELDEAIKKAKSHGWKVINATKAVNRLRQVTSNKKPRFCAD
ncbi:hypothetical protein [Crocosphaera sp. XPORK-15E]|uniref:hypothetical protein n=1 Tax=Crocosphaera sp. XPORK-15E TaxID=3110247 RepID=UPI002B1ED59E|nr:hypothetical protein [Crocosphaera sp. XPORK-15E]MEA5537049.1 hypothetical protein [Crocosphaera sp. XPORK-15E]